MQAHKLISLFFLKLVGIYLLFVVVWTATGASGCYAAQFQTVGSWFFGAFSFGTDGRIRIDEMDRPTNLWDSNLHLSNRKTGAEGTLPFGSHGWGYAPTIMVTSLILATPIPWRSRVRALLWGLLVVHGWIGLEILLAGVNAFSGPSTLAVYSLHPTVQRGLAFVTEVVTKSTATRYAISTMIWAAVTFRQADRGILLAALSRTTHGREIRHGKRDLKDSK